jgi:hypothetical protein
MPIEHISQRRSVDSQMTKAMPETRLSTSAGPTSDDNAGARATGID